MIFRFFDFLAKYALFGSRNIDGMKEWAMKDIFCLVNWANRAESDEIYAKTLPYCYCFMLLMIGRRKKLRRRAKLKRTPMWDDKMSYTFVKRLSYKMTLASWWIA